MTFTTPGRKNSPRTRKKYIDFKRLLRRSNVTVSKAESIDETPSTPVSTKSSVSNKINVSEAPSVTENNCHRYNKIIEEIKCNKSITSAKPENHSKKSITSNIKPSSAKSRKAISPKSKSSDTDNEINTPREKQVKHNKSINKKTDTRKYKSRKCQIDALSNTTVNSTILTPHEIKHQPKNKRNHIKTDRNMSYKSSTNNYRTNDHYLCQEDEINYSSRKLNKYHKKHFTDEQHKIAQYVNSECDMSQFSTPICRDIDVKEDQELYFKDCDRRCPNSEEYDVACYKSNMNSRMKKDRKRSRYTDVYNDTTLYDVIPVKESGFRHRRNHIVNEVLPSPKTHRPKLNLDCYYVPEIDSYVCSHEVNSKINLNQDERHKNIKRRCDKGDEGDLSYNFNLKIPQSSPLQNDNSHEHSADTERSEKVLNEIKDVLQTFLEEVRNVTATVNENNSEVNMSKSRSNDASNQNKTPPPQYMAPPYNPFLQLLPIYPVNCVHPNCAAVCSNCANTNGSKKDDTNKNSLTEDMVKEIYKHVIEKPTSSGTKNIKTSTNKLKTQSKSCEVFTLRSSVSALTTQRSRPSFVMNPRNSKGKLDDDIDNMSESTLDSIITIKKNKMKKFLKLFRKFGILKKTKELDYQVESEPQLHNAHIHNNYTMNQKEGRDPHLHKYGKEKHSYIKHEDVEHAQRKPEYSPDAKAKCYMSLFPNKTQSICLKEIEVKSTATQSDNKIKKYVFKAFKKQMESIKKYKERENIVQHVPINCCKSPFNSAAKNSKIKNVMLQKLFFRKNPLNPLTKNNPLVSTLLSKNIGEPKTFMTPRLLQHLK